MDAVLKKGLGLIVVVFILWFLFTNPAGLASLSREAGIWLWHMLTQLFTAIATFLNGVLA